VLTNYIIKFSPIIMGLEGRISFVNSLSTTQQPVQQTTHHPTNGAEAILYRTLWEVTWATLCAILLVGKQWQ
jgi:hypothetical protein